MDLKELVAQAKVSSPTGRRALEELVREGMVSRTGKGKRGNAFLYFLPGNRFFSTSNPEGESWKETNQE
jgi:predicted HTH transcriptional regulator